MKKTKSKLDKRAIMAVLLCTTFTFATPFVSTAAEEAEEDTGQTANTAQEAENTGEDFLLGGVVVTATRTEVEQFRANANVSVITAADIEKNHWTDLTQVLRSVPGVTILQYGIAGHDTANTFRINGSNDVAVLVDGVKVSVESNTAGNFAPSMFTNLENIERIEILKGSASTLYGSAAKGGVVNIITKKIDGVKNTLTIGGGSFGAENYSFNHQGRQDAWSWRMQYKKDIADDFKDGDGRKWISRHNGEDWAFLLKREFNEKSDLSITYDSHDSNAYYEDFYSPNGAFYDTNNHNVVATYNFRFNDKTSNQLSYSYIYFDYTGRDSTSSYKPRRTLIKTQRISDQFTRQINDKHTLVAGFEYTKDKVRNTYGFNGEPAIFKDIDNTSYYIQDEWRFADNWKLTGGVRHDNHSAFGNYTSPSVNLGYEFNSDTNMYVSYNKFFVAPNANELYSSYGDPNLKPETGHTSEIGINHKFNDTLVMTAHLFKRNTKDYIAYSAGRYRNVGNEKADGWDIQFRKKVSKDINAYIGYTHINVDPLTAGARSNERGYIPKGLWNIGVDYSKEKFDVSLLGRGIIDRPGPGIGVTNFPQSTYWLWDLGLNYRTSPTTKVFLKVNNIFDTLYAEHTNVSYGGAQAWWSMPGRSFTAGVQYTF